MKRYILSNSIILIVLTLLLLIGSYLGWQPLRLPEAITYDRLLSLRPAKQNDAVVLVAIDAPSIRQIGPWPWPRDIVARGIQRLSRSGAKVMGLSLLYSERALDPALEELDKLKADLGPARTQSQRQLAARISRRLSAIRHRLDQDRHLINAVRNGNNMVLPYRIVFGPPDAEAPPQLPGLLTINSLRAENQPAGPPLPLAALRKAVAPFREPSMVPIAVQETFRDLGGKAGALGYINLLADSDGVVRRWPLLQRS
ncbi:MAG: CHASE2 domain-containing protein, partial [Desulfosarcina sp.]|nr:CHASE2 domain-containing protein [Desulfobacterales bacterium]